MQRHELTDQEWDLLDSLVPSSATGQPRVDGRQVINGMIYKIRRSDVPARRSFISSRRRSHDYP